MYFGEFQRLYLLMNRAMKRAKCVRVFIHAPEGLPGILADQAAKPRARHVDKYQVADVEQGIGIVDQLVRSSRHVPVAIRHHMLGTKRAHVQPDGRAAGTAVVEKRDGTIFRLGVFLQVGHVKHARHRRRIFGFFGLFDRKLAAGLRLAIRIQLHVLYICRAHVSVPAIAL